MRILIAHTCHFSTLSTLFFLPVFFSLVVYPCFHLAFFHPDFPLEHLFYIYLSISPFEILILLVYSLVVLLLFICGVATITHSAIQTYYDQPISLVSSIKSIPNSFFPLLSTFVISSTIYISITLIFSCIALFVIRLKTILPLMIVLIPILIWLKVKFSLANVVAVVESKYGFETLRRSACLIKESSWGAFLSMMSYVPLIIVIIASFYISLTFLNVGNVITAWDSMMGMEVRLLILVSSLASRMMKRYLVTDVVIYMYCKDSSVKKSPLKGGDEFSDQYVALPIDDDQKKNEAAALV